MINPEWNSHYKALTPSRQRKCMASNPSRKSCSLPRDRATMTPNTAGENGAITGKPRLCPRKVAHSPTSKSHPSCPRFFVQANETYFEEIRGIVGKRPLTVEWRLARWPTPRDVSRVGRQHSTLPFSRITLYRVVYDQGHHALA